MHKDRIVIAMSRTIKPQFGLYIYLGAILNLYLCVFDLECIKERSPQKDWIRNALTVTLKSKERLKLGWADYMIPYTYAY